MDQVKNVVVLAVAATALYRLVKNYSYWRSAKHALPYARPERVPPNPKYFPRHLQNRSGLWLHWQCWRDVESHGFKAPKGVVLIVQGLGDYGCRYEIVGRMFNRLGYYAYTIDHQGQGLSEGERKHAERFEHLVDDQLDFLAHVRKTEAGDLGALPTFLFGHSMGGLISALLGERHPSMFRGVVLSAPALHVDEDMAPPHLRRLALWLSNHFPKLPLPNGAVNPLTRNKQLQEFADQDNMNLLYVRIRARFAAEFLGAMDRCMKDAPTKATFPMLIIHGTADVVTPISGSELFFQAAASTDKQFHRHEGLLHDFLHDDEVSDKVAQDIGDFYNKRLV